METTNFSELTLVDLVEQIVAATQRKKFSDKSIAKAQPYIDELASRFGITANQALLLAVFLNNYEDDEQSKKDIAKFFNCPGIRMIKFSKDIEALVKKDLIRKTSNYCDETCYFVPKKTVEAFENNCMPKPKEYGKMTALELVDHLTDLLQELEDNKLNSQLFHDEVDNLFRVNENLLIIKAFNEAEICGDDFILFAVLITRFVQYNDENVGVSVIEDYFENQYLLRHQIRELENGSHSLMTDGWVEFGFEDGQLDTSSWKLTEKAKSRFLSELNLTRKKRTSTDTIQAESIIAKQLFYNEVTSHQISRLDMLLSKEQFHQIQQRLKDKGMRQGFACIFYGAPGTGKTETVLQLAKRTGRNIMQANIPALRSKWVGETEKNIKEVFDNYRSFCRGEDLEPILLFNEADAILGKRQEGATRGVDKMENAMQNIILQEMENLNGIMIATTNLSGNLDAAFERRFLYKVEFTKPTTAECRHIWQAMLTCLTDEQAQTLAEQFHFTGGQIENIARKYTVETILSTETENYMDTIRKLCAEEKGLLHNRRAIGFYANES